MGSFRPLAIVNPRSSNGKTGRHWPRLKEEIAQRIGTFDARLTQGPGDATLLTREGLRQGYDLILSVGGDGTHHEVVNGFFDGTTPVAPQAALAVLTSGTGGDFRKTLGLASGPEAALPTLEGDHSRMLDVGRFTYIDLEGNPRSAYFLNILSFGIGGLVDHYVNTTTKAMGGKVSFVLGTLRAMLGYRSQPVRISLDGGAPFERGVHMCALANGRYFGGGMFVAPEAQPDDGLLDCVIMKDFNTLRFLAMSRYIYAGTHINHPNVECMRARTIEAWSLGQGPVLLDVDGEPKGALPIKVEVLHHALRLKTQAPLS